MSREPARSGTTLAEVALTVVLLALVMAIALPAARRGEDRRRVHGAALHAAALLAAARDRAVAGGSAVAVTVDTGAGVLRAVEGGTVVRERRLGELFGVRLAGSRDSLAFDARGLGVGAANLTLVLRRGNAAETLAVSRLGRVRW